MTLEALDELLNTNIYVAVCGVFEKYDNYDLRFHYGNCEVESVDIDYNDRCVYVYLKNN